MSILRALFFDPLFFGVRIRGGLIGREAELQSKIQSAVPGVRLDLIADKLVVMPSGSVDQAADAVEVILKEMRVF